MKRILFTAAEEEEITCAIQAYRIMEPVMKGNFDVDFMLTGIGTTSTCYKVLKKILEAKYEKRPYDLAINIGIAGSYDIHSEKSKPGGITLIGKEYFGDLGFETLFGFQTLFQSQILDADAFPFQNGAIKRHSFNDKMENMLKHNFYEATGVTVQTVTGRNERRNEIIEKFDPDIESMEGAAFFYVCTLENIPFLELRSVSNEVGETDRSKWQTSLALSSLKGGVKQICQYLSENVSE